MFKLLRKGANKFMFAAICLLAVGAFLAAPLSASRARSTAPAAKVWYYGYYDTYYADATKSDIVGEYNSCTGVLVGSRTIYKDTETIICN